MTPFAIAGVQMPVGVLHGHLDQLLRRLEVLMVRFPWTQMVLFSELALSGPIANAPQPLPGETEARLQAAAARHGVWLLPGSLFEQGADGRLYNTCPVIAPDGSVVARYRKMFPFRPYEADVAGGDTPCVFDVPGVGRFGLLICYDIWFPEVARSLTAAGAEVLLHPVLTGTVDRDVELSIARATAAQFQSYLFDINGLAAGGVGRSCIVDPAGNVLYQAGGQEEFMPLEIDLDQVRRQRETGIRGLGQVLKSWRDRTADFPVYRRDAGADAYLQTLGPLQMPQRGTTAGLQAGPPANALAADPPLRPAVVKEPRRPPAPRPLPRVAG